MKTKLSSALLAIARRSLAFSVMIACMASGRAYAELLAFDDFNYAPVGGDLNGQSGGGSFGFTDAWSGNTSYNIGDGSLTSPTGLPPTTGNSMTTVAFGENRGINRTLSTPLGADNTTVYFSFLVRPEGILNQGFADGWFALALRGSTDLVVGMISPSSNYGLTLGFEDDLSSHAAVVGETRLLVTRIDFTEGIDTVRLYVDPVGDEPVVADAELAFGSFNNMTVVSLTGPGANSLDAIRIGTTWADVTVPEPSSFVLAALGIFAGLALVRRHAPRRIQRDPAAR